MRSQIAFARGAAGGLVRIRMPSAAKTASNARVNRECRSRSRNVIAAADSGAVSEVPQQGTGGVGGPRPGRVHSSRRAEGVGAEPVIHGGDLRRCLTVGVGHGLRSWRYDCSV
jgi:hypothetical protein